MPKLKESHVLQAFRFPNISSIELLHVVDEFIREEFDYLLNSNIHIGIKYNGKIELRLPAYSSKSKLTGVEVSGLHDILKKNYQAVMNLSDLGRVVDSPGTIKLDDYLPLFFEGIIVAAMDANLDSKASAESIDYIEGQEKYNKQPAKIDSDNKEVFILVQGSSDELSESVTKILRHGRDVKIHPLGTKKQPHSAVFMSFSDLPEEYGTVTGWIARNDYPENLKLLIPMSVGNFKFWLPVQETRPAGEKLALLGSILGKAKWLDAEKYDFTDLFYLPVGEANATLYVCNLGKTEMQDREISADIEPVEPFNLRVIEALDADSSKIALEKAIEDHHENVGYRVSIKPVPNHVAAEFDTEKLLEKIQELEETVAQINALKAPQLRLMRFSDEQLPALIDALRSLPPDELKNGDIRYASGHSTGRTEPVHYVLYDPMSNLMRVNEIIWRDRTVDHSISYWLEPFVAEAQITRPSKTKVFVPMGHFLVPSLAHFGSDIDGALSLVLGKLFKQLGEVVADSTAEPMYIFSNMNDPAFKLEVEVVDLRSFHPVHAQLPWMNKYLMVRGSQLVDEEDLREVAMDLYQGRAAENIKGQIEGYKSTLEHEWVSATTKIESENLEIFNALISDIDSTAVRIKDAYEFIKLMGERLDTLELVMEEVSKALTLKEQATEALAGKDKEILLSRINFLDRLRTEASIGEANLVQAEKRISELKRRIKTVLERDSDEK